MIYCKDADIPTIFKGVEIIHRKKGMRAPQKSRRDYISIISAFDIETSRFPEIDNSIMYIWQWGFYDLRTKAHICCIYGRTWEEYAETCLTIKSILSEIYSPSADLFMVRLIHNLSYEFQFLSGIYEYGQNDVFCIEKRKPVRADCYGCIEDRCTYVHSNLSLRKYAQQWSAQHQKLSGIEFDYEKIRLPDTALTDKELAYCENDILSLIDAYTNEMQYYDDDLYSVPLTSTGYVRREVKRAWAEIPYYTRKKWVVSDLELYNLLNKAFRGGNTHANRFCVAPSGYGPFIEHDVKSYDRSSSYPDVMCNMLFPLGKWRKISGVFNADKIQSLKKHNYACVFKACFKKIELSDIYWGCPYISLDKCENLCGIRDSLTLEMKGIMPTCNYIVDNGRILQADEITLSLTDIDMEIINGEYKYSDVIITDLWVCNYMKLPAVLTNLICGYYTAKTSLKGVSGHEWKYAAEKSKINAIYGMCAQKIVRDKVLFDDVSDDLYIIEKGNAEGQLSSAEKRGFMPFSIGVWVTAWARYWLERAIKLIHDTAGAEFVYTDTDSVKFTGDVDFSALNDEIRANSIKNGAFADDKNGKRHYMGIYEFEGEYPKFATMGAKKYIYGDDEKLHVTIAGVVKYNERGEEISAKELQKVGGFSAFRDGMIFYDAGGVEAVYNDHVDFNYEYSGKLYHITRNICLKPSSYTLGLSGEYDRTLKFILSGIDNKNIL